MKIEFKEDFATRKKGDVVDFYGILGTNLINRGLAKKYVQKRARKPRENKNGKPNTEDK